MSENSDELICRVLKTSRMIREADESVGNLEAALDAFEKLTDDDKRKFMNKMRNISTKTRRSTESQMVKDIKDVIAAAKKVDDLKRAAEMINDFFNKVVRAKEYRGSAQLDAIDKSERVEQLLDDKFVELGGKAEQTEYAGGRKGPDRKDVFKALGVEYNIGVV